VHTGCDVDGGLMRVPFGRIHDDTLVYERGKSHSTVYPGTSKTTNNMIYNTSVFRF